MDVLYLVDLPSLFTLLVIYIVVCVVAHDVVTYDAGYTYV